MMISRYRSYTSYSDENGKLVPSIEPFDNKLVVSIVSSVTTDINNEKKLKSNKPEQIITTDK
jgi:hypothetical protein